MRLWLRALPLVPLGFFCSAARDATEARPNIVMIVADDQAWGDYGFMGHRHIRTPNIDRLARESLVFRRGYVPSSLCRASLATMITGLYPHQHGVTSNDPPLPAGETLGEAMRNPAFLALRRKMAAKIERAETIPKALARAGYASLQAGKWWEGDSCRCGFTDGMTHGDPSRGGRHGDEGLKIGREGLAAVTQFIDRAVDSRKPFFLWYAPMMPHQPHNPPLRILKSYQTKTSSPFEARYWAMIEWFDETVGGLLEHIENRRITDNTLVVYICDNGWIQDPEADGYAPRSKRSPYEGGIRTPILLRLPGRIRAGENESLASSIDLAPTILKAAGVKSRAKLPGINLLDSQRVRERTSVFGAIFSHNAADIDDPAANLQYRWMIDRNHKLILPAKGSATPRVELFDLLSDPNETTNLAATEKTTVFMLTTAIEKWWPARRSGHER